MYFALALRFLKIAFIIPSLYRNVGYIKYRIIFESTFLAKTLAKVNSFGSNFFHLAEVLAITNSEPGLALLKDFAYLTSADMLTTGKKSPSRLKSLNSPLITSPFSVKDIWGMVRSRPHPIMSPFVNTLSARATFLHFPPVEHISRY